MTRIAYSPRPKNMTRLDVRDWPLYSLAEIAYFLDIPKSTLHSWSRTYADSRGQDVLVLIEPSDRRESLYSFFNLIEAHILSVTTKVHGVKLGAIRSAMKELGQQNLGNGQHPLLSREFFTDGKDIFANLLEKTVNLSRGGQLGLRPILDSYLERIERDRDFKPTKLYPGQQSGKIICMLPGVSSGRPVIDGTGIPVASVWTRYQAGDTIEFIADDYDIAEKQVQGAIQYVKRLKAA